MTADELARARDDVIAQHGPWTGYNLHLGHGIYTIAPGRVGAAELNVARVVQIVADLAQRPLGELRILDLGAHECGFAIELAAQGADVVAIEVREQHVAKGEFVRAVLALDRLTIMRADVRNLDPGELGAFDVVLCLGILYHLSAPDAISLLRTIAACTGTFALIETQISLSRSKRIEHDGVTYSGRIFKEAVGTPGSSVGAPETFWFTRASLLRALAAAGFTTVAEMRLPFVPAILPFADHLTVVAGNGPRVAPRVVESGGLDELWELPERWPLVATQGLRMRARERWARRRGGGMAALFPRPPADGD